MFLVPLDEQRHWYRYHQLFAQMLRERLASGASPDLVASLHRRAAGWFEQRGLFGEAIEHAVAAQEWEQAVRLLEQQAEPMLMRGEFRTLQHRVERLPRAVIRRRPHLLLAQAWAHFLAAPHQTDVVEALLREVEVMPGFAEGWAADPGTEPPAPDTERAELRGKIAAIRASIAGNQDDIPRTIARAR